MELGRVRLSQIAAPLTVVVTDPRGAPFSGAKVTLQGQTVPVETDKSGVATFASAPAGEVTAVVQAGGFTVKKTGPTDQTLFVTVPVCADGPILSNTELVVLFAGAGVAGFGFYKKSAAAQMVGETLLAAGIFSAVYRASCRW